MKACVDVSYSARAAIAAALTFHSWSDGQAAAEHVTWVAEPRPYVPGSFFQRELPCIVAVLELIEARLEVIVVDGVVWQDGTGTPGLGAHLWEHLGRTTPVVGVAKSQFGTASHAVPVLRGRSGKPLWVTAVGLEPSAAGRHVAAMSGQHRIPNLLAQVHRLSRDTAR